MSANPPLTRKVDLRTKLNMAETWICDSKGQASMAPTEVIFHSILFLQSVFLPLEVHLFALACVVGM